MDAHFIRSRLEMELNIEVLILDELSVQAAPFASNIMGGVRIQVREDQVEIARDFLIEHEYIKLEENKPNVVISSLAKFTQKIPLLNNLRVEARLLIFVTFLLAVIIVPLVLFFQPIKTTAEDLTERSWCITKITRFGREIERNSNVPYFFINGCKESIAFNKSNRLDCPQYDDNFHQLKWRLQDQALIIENARKMDDSLPESILVGEYEIDMSKTNLTLSTRSVRIECKRMVY
jgi:hypothetical protein